jgi:hypothetical protein
MNGGGLNGAFHDHKDKSVLKAATELRLQAEERLRAKTAELHPPETEKATQRHLRCLHFRQTHREKRKRKMDNPTP